MARISIGSLMITCSMLVSMFVGCGGLDDTREAAQASSMPVEANAFCQIQCVSGGTLSCDTPTCSASTPDQYVICDGVKKLCPCTASAACEGGGSVSCNGGGLGCESHDQYVACDGVVHGCPCSAQLGCEAGNFLTCTGTSGPDTGCWTLGAISDKVCGGVECNGAQQYCDPLPGEKLCF